jgi:hypothetical protein
MFRDATAGSNRHNSTPMLEGRLGAKLALFSGPAWSIRNICMEVGKVRSGG